MLTSLQTRLKKAGRWLPVFLLPFAAQAQTLGYSASNAVNVTGTYTDLGTNGTAIATASTDDANSAVQSIGFPFTFNGTAYTQFILNTNGLIKLGSTAPATAALYYQNFAGGSGVDPLGTAGAAETNLIMPFNFDLVQGTGTAEYRVATTGATPNRVCTIQWENVSDKSETAAGGALSQYANFSFQAKLYENGMVEFVYDAPTASANATATRFPNVGLKGSSTAVDNVTLALKGVPGSAWSTTTFINQNYGLQAHNVNKLGVPDAGRTYRFVTGAPAVAANDDCSGATPLTVGTTCSATTVSNATATSSTTAPASTCDISSTGTPNPIDNDIWYTAVVPANGSITVATSAVAGSTVDDTVLELYTGTCSSLTSVACNDDAPGSSAGNYFSSATASNLTPGSTVYVRVWSFTGSSTGQFGICATVGVPAPANDNPSGAIALPLSATCTPTNTTNAAATTTTPVGYANPGCGIATAPKDVWYTFTTAASGQQGATAVNITVTGAPAGQVRVFSGAGTTASPFVQVGCSAGTTNNTVAAPLNLTGLTPATTYYVFVSGYGSGDTQGAFTICATIINLPATDAAVTSVFTLGTVSGAYGSPVQAQAIVTNAGAATLTNVPVTLTVTGATNYTSQQTIASLAPGASTTLTYNYAFLATNGTNTVTATVAAPGDAVTTNNAKTVTQTIAPLTQSHFATPPAFANGIGSNGTANIMLLARYHVNSAAPVTSVTPTFFGTATAANTYQVVIYSAVAANGLPGTLLYTSPTRSRPATATSDPVAIPNISVNGDFFVGVKQLTTTNVGLAFVTDSPLRPNTFFISSNGTTFTDLNTSTLAPRLGINVGFAPVSSTQNEALAATVSLYPNPAHQSFKLALPAGSLNSAAASLINALGQVVLTRQLSLPAAGGSADFDVSHLAAGVYSLQLKSGNDLVVKRVVVE
ncbi:MAG: hypothetical protein JWR44_76 [Hymenobacter sp.]|nr:hypothetical protein [Hymenobacter sp.]